MSYHTQLLLSESITGIEILGILIALFFPVLLAEEVLRQQDQTPLYTSGSGAP